MSINAQPRRRWRLGRLAVHAAIIAVAVSIGLEWLAPKDRGGCGMTPEWCVKNLGLGYLGLWAIGSILPCLSDQSIRNLATRMGLLAPDPHSKPEPRDEF